MSPVGRWSLRAKGPHSARSSHCIAATKHGQLIVYGGEHKPRIPVDAAISELTMFADYRVPQILHHLRILDYPPALVKKLLYHEPFAPGCKEEISIRAASIVSVERVRQEILRLKSSRSEGENSDASSVLIDFYLWDLAKRIEVGDDVVSEIETTGPLPIHRTRSIWY